MTRLLLGLVLLATVAIYAPTRHGLWIYEDLPTVQTAAPWQGWGEVPLALHWPRIYDPEIGLTNFTFRAQERLGFTGAASAHLVNLALFLGAGLLVAGLAARLGLPAWLAAGIFLLHPINVEAVAYVSKRGELLAAIGILACLHLVLMRGRAWWRAGFAALVTLLVWHIKAPAVVIVALVPLFAIHVRGASSDARRLVAVGVSLSVCLVVIFSAPVPIMAQALEGRSAFVVFAGQSTALWHLLREVVWPVGGFTVDYDAAVVAPVLQVLAAYAVVMGAIVTLVRWSSGCRTWGDFAAVWVCMALVPRFVFPSTEWINEHQMLTPMIGLTLALAGGLRWAAQELLPHAVSRLWPRDRARARRHRDKFSDCFQPET